MRKFYKTPGKLLPGALRSLTGRFAPEHPAAANEHEERGYALALRLRYRAYHGRKLVGWGQGKTITISARSVLFSTVRPLERGLRAELFIDWPAQRDDHSPLQLYVSGHVGLSAGERVLVRISHHDFRVWHDTGASSAETRSHERS